MVLSIILIMVAICARFLLAGSAMVNPGALWYCTHARLDSIAIGILVSLLLCGRVPPIGSAARVALFLAGALCLCVAAVWFHRSDDDVSLLDATLAYPLADVGALPVFLSSLGAGIAWPSLI